MLLLDVWPGSAWYARKMPRRRRHKYTEVLGCEYQKLSWKTPNPRRSSPTRGECENNHSSDHRRKQAVALSIIALEPRQHGIRLDGMHLLLCYYNGRVAGDTNLLARAKRTLQVTGRWAYYALTV